MFVSAAWNLHDAEGRRPLAPVLQAIAKTTPDWHPLVVGDGDHDAAQTLVGELGLAGRVHLLGPVPEAWRVNEGSDLLVNASHFEGLSISFLEAWSLGAPVLSTRVDGIEDIVGAGDLAAVSAEHGDVDGFARRWDEVGDQGAAFDTVSAAATTAVRARFTRERRKNELLELYDFTA